MIIEAFGQEYPLPVTVLSRSKVLMNAFSGKYAEKNRIELNLDPLLQPAWELVYRQLLLPHSVGSWAQLRNEPPELLWDFFNLADYLDIDELVDDFRKLIINGKIPSVELGQYLDRYQQYPALVQAAAVTIILDNNSFAALPFWVQQIFPTYQTMSLPPNGFLLARVAPLNYIQLYLPPDALTEAYGPNYSQICEEARQPRPLTPSGVGQFAKNVRIHKENDLYLICPGSYPLMNYQGGVPCCGVQRGGPAPPRVKIPWDSIGERKTMIAQGGYLVFIDPQLLHGDYIVTRNYQLLPDINAVIV